MLLLYLGTHVPASARRPYLDALLQHFRAVPKGTVTARATFLAKLKPGQVDEWFANPRRPEGLVPIRMLARALQVDHLVSALRRRARSHAMIPARPLPVTDHEVHRFQTITR